jgi:hypothetical protein
MGIKSAIISDFNLQKSKNERIFVFEVVGRVIDFFFRNQTLDSYYFNNCVCICVNSIKPCWFKRASNFFHTTIWNACSLFIFVFE